MINPYNFVRSDKRLDKPAVRRRPTEQDRIVGRSGTLICSLETKAPIFTPAFTVRSPGSQPKLSFFRIDSRPAIPGSSLKGMVRSLAEALVNGCSPFSSPIHPQCRSVKSLCQCCRLFGHLKGGEVYSGKVNISDALVADGYQLGQRVTLKELGSPKERHSAFYGEAGRNRARKFYYHQQHIQKGEDIPTETRPTHRNAVVEPLLYGKFRFSVRYWHLDDNELGLLLHALELPAGLFHKLGMGKPLGLGTIRIDIRGWTENILDPVDPAWRYHHLGQSQFSVSLEDLHNEQSLHVAEGRLRQRVDDVKKTYAHSFSRLLGEAENEDLWALRAENIEDLKIILSQVPYSKEIRYPGYAWFRDLEKKDDGLVNADRQLSSIQEVHTGRHLRD